MNYLNITKYIYLIIGILMTYNAITTWNSSVDKPWLSAILSAAALFTFFFRMRFSKKFDDRTKTNNSTKI